MSTEVIHICLEDIPFQSGGDKLFLRSLEGKNITLLNCKFEKGCLVPLHQHESEQISIIVKGCLKGKIGGKEYLVKSGDVIKVPPNLLHEWVALEETISLEVFSPPRERPNFE